MSGRTKWESINKPKWDLLAQTMPGSKAPYGVYTTTSITALTGRQVAKATLSAISLKDGTKTQTLSIGTLAQLAGRGIPSIVKSAFNFFLNRFKNCPTLGCCPALMAGFTIESRLKAIFSTIP